MRYIQIISAILGKLPESGIENDTFIAKPGVSRGIAVTNSKNLARSRLFMQTNSFIKN